MYPFGWSLSAPEASAEGIPGAGDENASAAGLTPNLPVDGSWGAVVVIAGLELAPVDPQLTGKKMQLFHARMGVLGIASRRAQGAPAC